MESRPDRPETVLPLVLKRYPNLAFVRCGELVQCDPAFFECAASFRGMGRWSFDLRSLTTEDMASILQTVPEPFISSDESLKLTFASPAQANLLLSRIPSLRTLDLDLVFPTQDAGYEHSLPPLPQLTNLILRITTVADDEWLKDAIGPAVVMPLLKHIPACRELLLECCATLTRDVARFEEDCIEWIHNMLSAKPVDQLAAALPELRQLTLLTDCNYSLDAAARKAHRARFAPALVCAVETMPALEKLRIDQADLAITDGEPRSLTTGDGTGLLQNVKPADLFDVTRGFPRGAGYLLGSSLRWSMVPPGHEEAVKEKADQEGRTLRARFVTEG